MYNYEKIQETVSCRLITVKQPLGCLWMGEKAEMNSIVVDVWFRPNWLHRVMLKTLLGIKYCEYKK